MAARHAGRAERPKEIKGKMSTMKSPFKSISDVRAKNTAEGYHWFERATMKFWKTRIESRLIDGRYFISSEDEFALDGRTPKRIYAVRFANDDGSIKTLASLLLSKESARDFIQDEVTKGRLVVAGEVKA